MDFRIRAATALVAVGLGSLALAQTASTEPTTAPAPPDKPLMAGLDTVGLAKPLKDAGINVYGYGEASYTHNFHTQPGDINTGRVFDFKDDELFLNQVNLTIERAVDLKKWDLGGRVEMIYGQDAGSIHSNGLLDDWSATRARGATRNTPENQFDIAQAYADLSIPIGNGLDVKFGKWYTLLGFETINPTTNPLYSHSYLFGYAIPFTNTGVLASYSFTDNWSASLGFSRGWEQAAEDNNGDAIDVTGEVKYTKDKLTLIFNFISGPEEAGDNSHFRTVLDGILTYNFTDKFSISLNPDYGWEDFAGTAGTAEWYGTAGYATYKIDDHLSVNARLEFFNDQDGIRTGAATTYYEATLGLAIHPFLDSFGSNFVLRPEVRYDHAEDAVFTGGSDKDQITAAIDAIFTF